MNYKITKRLNDVVSVCFRQWRATSHCRFLHGYCLTVEIVIEANSLDEKNWVYDFGEFKVIEAVIKENFDHKLIVATDDPDIQSLAALEDLGAARMKVLPNVSTECFAREIFYLVANRIPQLTSVTIYENNKNSATYTYIPYK